MLKHLKAGERFAHRNLLEKGFTLVELLVVIVILGILAGVVIFAVGSSTEDARTNACEAEYDAVVVAVEAWRAQESGDDPAAGMGDLTGPDGNLARDPLYWDWDGSEVVAAGDNTGSAGTCTFA